MFSEKNIEEIAIITIGYNRLNSTKRLFSSLLKADYSRYDNVPLVICIDCSNYYALYDYVENFQWPFGNKYVIIQEERQGLKKHIFKCCDLVENFKAVIILEDDTYVSRNFYNYTNDAVDYYEKDEKIASIALYNNSMNGFCWLPNELIYSGSDVYLSQFVSTSGECWTRRMWMDFRNWFKDAEINWDKLDMPEQEKLWNNSWSKYFDAYMLIKNKFSIYPYVSQTTNFGDVGVHSSINDTLVQENLQYGLRKHIFKPSDELVCYSTQGATLLETLLKIDNKDLCVDLHNCNSNVMKKRYFLTFKHLNYHVVKSYGLMLRPVELNIFDEISGNDIFLYDTHIKGKKPKGSGLSNLILYHLHGFNYKYLIWAVILRTNILIKKILHKLF